MADNNTDVQGLGKHSYLGISNMEDAFNNALERTVEPFYVAKS
jgi:hypothetical protein